MRIPFFSLKLPICNDEVCPPTSMYAAYNIITAKKELHPYLETGHYLYQEQSDEWNKWLCRQLGL